MQVAFRRADYKANLYINNVNIKAACSICRPSKSKYKRSVLNMLLSQKHTTFPCQCKPQSKSKCNRDVIANYPNALYPSAWCMATTMTNCVQHVDSHACPHFQDPVYIYMHVRMPVCMYPCMYTRPRVNTPSHPFPASSLLSGSRGPLSGPLQSPVSHWATSTA